jgi:hypothetical protein
MVPPGRILHEQFYCESSAKRKQAFPGNVILLNGVSQPSNPEIGFPGFHPTRFVPRGKKTMA